MERIKRTNKFIPVWIVLLFASASLVYAGPTLLMSERKGKDEKQLVAVHFDKEAIKRETILSSPNGFDVTQLDGSRILITDDGYSANQTAYVFNLHSHVLKLIAAKQSETKKSPIQLGRRSTLRCLRSVPERQTAVLLVDDHEAHSLRFYELNLATFQVTHRHTLSEKIFLGKTDDGLSRFALHKMRISPDFNRIAFPAVHGSKSSRLHQSFYDLKLLDLGTGKITTIVEDIYVHLPVISSFSHGFPPFEWLNDDEILFQNIVADKSDKTMVIKGAHQLKSVRVKNGNIRDCLKMTARLELNGGDLRRNPVTGHIEYQHKWIVNVKEGMLAPKNAPFSSRRSQNQTAIRYNREVLYEGPSWCADICISRSRLHAAYRLRDHGKGGEPDTERVIVKIAGRENPIKIAEAVGFSTKPFAWVEEEKTGKNYDK